MNRQSQSQLSALMPRTQLPSAGAPWCISLSSRFLLTLLFLSHPFQGAIDVEAKPQCQPPCPNFLWSMCLFFFPPFDAQEKCIFCSQHKTLIRHSTTDVTQRERRTIHFSCIHDCVLITSEKTPPAYFSMSHMPTDRFPSLGEPFFIAHSPTCRDGGCSAVR